MYDFQGKTVLITGGSTGIGAALADEVAARGARVALVARGRAKLDEVAGKIEKDHGRKVHVFSLDLGADGAAVRLHEAVRAAGLAVDVLVNNAGFGVHGRFEEQSLQQQHDMVALNVGALVELTHVFLPELLERKGGIIQVASIAGFQPISYMPVYAATKAFVISFSEALWAAYRKRGLRVLALCPGATDTQFFERSGEGAAAGVPKAPPRDVARVGLKAFDRNRSYVIHGAKNYVAVHLSRLLPRELTARAGEMISRPRD
ncbi:MAG: SDR family oxidoreductase [Minicystis sp.]